MDICTYICIHRYIRYTHTHMHILHTHDQQCTYLHVCIYNMATHSRCLQARSTHPVRRMQSFVPPWSTQVVAILGVHRYSRRARSPLYISASAAVTCHLDVFAQTLTQQRRDQPCPNASSWGKADRARSLSLPACLPACLPPSLHPMA